MLDSRRRPGDGILTDHLGMRRLQRELKIVEALSTLANFFAGRIDAEQRRNAAESELTTTIINCIAKLRSDLTREIDDVRNSGERVTAIQSLRAVLQNVDELANALAGLHTMLQDPTPLTQDFWQRHRLPLVNAIGQALEAGHGLRGTFADVVNVLAGDNQTAPAATVGKD